MSETTFHNGALPTVLKSEHDAEVNALKAQLEAMKTITRHGSDAAIIESLRALNRDLVEALKVGLDSLLPCNPQWPDFPPGDCPAGHTYECGNCYTRRLMESAIEKGTKG